MHIFEATVRVGPTGFMVKTRVMAYTCEDARLLLRGQYGEENLLSDPRQID